MLSHVMFRAELAELVTVVMKHAANAKEIVYATHSLAKKASTVRCQRCLLTIPVELFGVLEWKAFRANCNRH